ncbi:MAG: hypothetical protein LUC49_04225 [Prevotella sp.]|nr:hypothetical protein [Prevotella sp.]
MPDVDENQGDNSDVDGDDSNVDGISAVAVDSQTNVSDYCSIDGKQVLIPTNGVNIVKYSDGTTKKVLVK